MNESVSNINRHLTDICSDVEKVRKTVSDTAETMKRDPELRPPLTEDQIISRLSDISNLLFDLDHDLKT